MRTLQHRNTADAARLALDPGSAATTLLPVTPISSTTTTKQMPISTLRPTAVGGEWRTPQCGAALRVWDDHCPAACPRQQRKQSAHAPLDPPPCACAGMQPHCQQLGIGKGSPNVVRSPSKQSNTCPTKLISLLPPLLPPPLLKLSEVARDASWRRMLWAPAASHALRISVKLPRVTAMQGGVASGGKTAARPCERTGSTPGNRRVRTPRRTAGSPARKSTQIRTQVGPERLYQADGKLHQPSTGAPLMKVCRLELPDKASPRLQLLQAAGAQLAAAAGSLAGAACHAGCRSQGCTCRAAVCCALLSLPRRCCSCGRLGVCCSRLDITGRRTISRRRLHIFATALLQAWRLSCLMLVCHHNRGCLCGPAARHGSLACQALPAPPQQDAHGSHHELHHCVWVADRVKWRRRQAVPRHRLSNS